MPGFERLVMQAVLAERFFRRWPGTVRAITFFGGLALAAAVFVLASALLPNDIVRLQGEAHPWLTVGSLALTVVLFERFLPYAMVAGLTRQWAAAFQGILEAPPRWYNSDGIAFDANDFGTSLEDCFSTTTGAMQASPSSSSSSSGSSGGGGF